MTEEPTSKRVITEFFPAHPDGDLWKGAVQPETNNEAPDWSRQTAFMQATDIASVSAIVDIDASVKVWAAEAGPTPAIPPRARAKSVIFLFMAGGPSQLELFDYKPKLQELDGQVVPPSVVANKRFAFLKPDAKLLGTRRKFARHGQCQAELSDALPHLAKVVDEIAIVKSMTTEAFNHAPAEIFLQTGSQQFGRPSMGSWLTYGLGSEARDLPGFVVLSTGGGASGARRAGAAASCRPPIRASRSAAPATRS